MVPGAHHVLARSLLEQGKPAKAREAIDRAVALKTQFTLDRLSIAITVARIRAASGDPDAALKELEAVMAEATERGLAGHALHLAAARVGEAEVEAVADGAGAAHRHHAFPAHA